MKNKILLFAFSLSLLQLSAQVSWTKMASLPGVGRDHAVAFSNGTKGYILTGENGTSGAQYKDFWEYDSSTDTWKQLTSYAGPVRSYGAGCVINNKAYIGFGHSGSTFVTDWWEYDFSTSTWSSKATFPGAGRDHPGYAVMNGKFYIGFGDNSGGNKNDWWQYDPATNAWTAKATYPGGGMHHPVTAEANGLIYLSEGHLSSGSGSKKFYSYNATANTWATLADMPGPGVVAGASFFIGGGKIYSGCGITEPAGVFHQEFYAYDIAGNTWTAIASYPGLGVFGPTSFVIGNAGYVCTGMDDQSNETKDLYKLSGTVALDAGVPVISTPNGIICSSSFTPVVTIQNFGISTLTSCTINYHLDSSPNQTQPWTGSLASGATAQVTLSPITGVSAGAHTFTSSTSGPNGSTDGNSANDQLVVSFNVNTTAAALPILEGFESNGTNLPNGWALYNPNSNTAWVVNASVAKTGSHSIYFDNCTPSTDITGQKDRFITTPYDFSAATSANMTFDVAYAKANISGTIYADTLNVYSSINCGTTWNKIYGKGGAVLATAPDITAASPTCFSPTSSQWRNDAVSLNSLLGQASVMFAFENRSGWAEGIYLDNINITAVVGIEEVNSLQGFTIYPNPATTSFMIEGLSSAEKIRYSLTNIVGEEIKTGDMAGNGTSFTGKIQVPDISRGLYFIRLSDEKNTWTKKVIIQ